MLLVAGLLNILPASLAADIALVCGSIRLVTFPFFMSSAQPIVGPKQQVAEFWDSEPCGTRYGKLAGGLAAHAQSRYELEPFIKEFADFASARGRRVLEVGVGMGADYLEWLKAGSHATGVDISQVSIQRAAERCRSAGYKPDLRMADAEQLPFGDATFDLVYSYGVLHHSPDTSQCIREVWRVLKPGGTAKLMLYGHPSLTGWMLWLRYGLWPAQSVRQAIYQHLESPGTKAFTFSELREMLSDFEQLQISQAFSPGDLLLHQPSTRFQGTVYRIIWALYPRWFVQRFCRKLGLFLLISARKPLA